MFSLCRGGCLLMTHWLVSVCKDEERGHLLLTVALHVLLRLHQSWITSSHQCYCAKSKTPLSPAVGLHPHFLPAAGLHYPHHRPHHTQTQVQRSGETSVSKYLTDIQIYVNIVRTFVLSVFYPQPSTRWATSHKHTHTSAPLKHTLRRVFLLLHQVWEESLQLRAFWDGFCWGDRVQPGGQKHRWGTSPPEREGQVCPHCGFNFTVCGVFPDYKNNLLKEKAHLSSPPKVIDLDKGNSYLSACLHMEQTIILI